MVFKRKLAVTIIPIIAVVCGVFGIAGCNDTDKHVHTYSDEWTRSTTEHWHEATCEHTDEKGDLGTHIDSDNNGKCDFCDYTMQKDDECNHTFESTWSYDGKTHWHAALIYALR